MPFWRRKKWTAQTTLPPSPVRVGGIILPHSVLRYTKS
jgi:hypothetical protein